MQTKDLLKVTYHYDTETGIVEVGEIDFAVCGELNGYIKNYGYKGVKEILAVLGHLAFEVIQTYYNLQKLDKLSIRKYMGNSATQP